MAVSGSRATRIDVATSFFFFFFLMRTYSPYFYFSNNIFRKKKEKKDCIVSFDLNYNSKYSPRCKNNKIGGNVFARNR